MANGRDANGRFVKGHKALPGAGRPKRKTEERYIRAMMNAVSIADWRQIIRTGVGKAIEGDLGWARFIADYLAGKPIQRQEITGAEGDPIVFEVKNISLVTGL